MKTNSQLTLAPWLYFGDVDGDGIDEVIQLNRGFMSVFRPDFDHTPVAGHLFPSIVSRLMIGDFFGSGREAVCGLLGDGSLQVYGLSPDQSEMWWAFTQPQFISDNEHYIVGDYDADGIDEVLVFRPMDGRLRMFKIDQSGGFAEVSSFQLGNLTGVDLRNKQILAGHFDVTRAGTNILVVDSLNRQILRYAPVVLTSGILTFWWCFTTRGGIFEVGDQVCVANLEGTLREGILIRSVRTGTYRFFRAEYDNQNLRVWSGTLAGQLPVLPGRGKLLPASVRDRAFRNERGGQRRHDLLFFDESARQIIRTDARYDRSAGQLTFWMAYSSNRLFIGSTFIFDTQMTGRQVITLLERHRFAYFQINSCSNLNTQERTNLEAAYRKGIRHGINSDINANASAIIGGSDLWINFGNLFPLGNTEIAQTLIHEMMHIAGYTHPNRRLTDQPFDGGNYYSSPPLRAEICIAGDQSDTARLASDRFIDEDLLKWLDHSACRMAGNTCYHETSLKPKSVLGTLKMTTSLNETSNVNEVGKSKGMIRLAVPA